MIRLTKYIAKRGFTAGIDLTAGKQEHHQYKYLDGRWTLGYMESERDLRHVKDVVASGPSRLGGLIFRGVYNHVFILHVWVSRLSFKISFNGRWKVDPEWDHLGGIETPWNEQEVGT